MLGAFANFGDPRLPERFWNKVQPCPMSGCWLWTGSTNQKGYGMSMVWVGGAKVNRAVHRTAFLAFGGIMQPDEEIDHRVCRVRCCCNPAHLESVTHAVNVSRADHSKNGARERARTHCPRGHEYNSENTYPYRGKRQCLPCRRAYSLEYQREKRRGLR